MDDAGPTAVRRAGLIETAGCAGDELARLREQNRIDGARQTHSGGRLCLEALHQSLEMRPRGRKTPQPAARRSEVRHRLAGEHARHVDVRADDLVQRIQMVAPAVALQQQLLLADEDASLQALARSERGLGEGERRVELALRQRGLGREPRVGEVLPVLVAAPVALRGRERGIRVEQALVGAVEQGRECARRSRRGGAATAAVAAVGAGASFSAAVIAVAEGRGPFSAVAIAVAKARAPFSAAPTAAAGAAASISVSISAADSATPAAAADATPAMAMASTATSALRRRPGDGHDRPTGNTVQYLGTITG